MLLPVDTWRVSLAAVERGSQTASGASTTRQAALGEPGHVEIDCRASRARITPRYLGNSAISKHTVGLSRIALLNSSCCLSQVTLPALYLRLG